MMTPLEAVRQLGAEAAPALAKNPVLALYIDVEKGDAGGRRRVSLDEAVLMAQELKGWKAVCPAGTGHAFCTGPEGSDGTLKTASYTRVLSVPPRRYWLLPNGEIDSSDGLLRRLELDLNAPCAGASEFSLEEMADVLAWHAVRYGWGDPARISLDWGDSATVSAYARKFVLRWFRKLDLRPSTDDAERLQKLMERRIAGRLAGGGREPSRMPKRKPVSWLDEVMALDPDPGGTALRELEELARRGFGLAFVSAWKPRDAGVRPGGEDAGLMGRAAAAELDRREILCRFRKDGRLEEDWLLAVWAEAGQDLRPPRPAFVRLAEFAEAAGRAHGQDAVLLVSGGKARLLDLKRERSTLLGPFGPKAMEAFFSALGRKGFTPMDAGEIRKAGAMPELTATQRMLGDLFRRKLDRCVEEGTSFAAALEGRIVRRPWAGERKAAPPKEEEGATRAASHYKWTPGEKVIVQLPLPEGMFETRKGTVAEVLRCGQVRVCTGEGASAKLGTYPDCHVHPMEDAFLCGDDKD